MSEFLPAMKKSPISAGIQTAEMTKMHGFEKKFCAALDLILGLARTKEVVMIVQAVKDQKR